LVSYLNLPFARIWSNSYALNGRVLEVQDFDHRITKTVAPDDEMVHQSTYTVNKAEI